MYVVSRMDPSYKKRLASSDWEHGRHAHCVHVYVIYRVPTYLRIFLLGFHGTLSSRRHSNVCTFNTYPGTDIHTHTQQILFSCHFFQAVLFLLEVRTPGVCTLFWTSCISLENTGVKQNKKERYYFCSAYRCCCCSASPRPLVLCPCHLP